MKRFRSIRRAVHAALLLPALAGAAPAAAQDLPEQRRVEIARRLQESTVTVQSGQSSGSGFVAGEQRWVITNSHVVRPALRYGVQVRFGSGAALAAQVVVDDPSHDLAILRVRGSVPARPLPLGDSDDALVGQTVLAFGSPYGLDGTLTQGIISARRDLPGTGVGGTARNLIQTDATINPGNSGGPLVNSRGEVIGVNTAILSRTGGSHGIGFAVPSNYVAALIQQLAEHPSIAEGQAPAPAPPAAPPRPLPSPPPAAGAGVYLGILGDDFAARGVSGVRIRNVVPGSPAARAGLAGFADPPPARIRQLGVPWTGHIIVAIDGHATPSLVALQGLLRRRQPGDRAVLTVTVGPDVLSAQAVVTLAGRPRR
ncbi:MAG: S1C family serine protease [Sandaracinaceae bacterium]